jgi:hypothetical protein
MDHVERDEHVTTARALLRQATEAIREAEAALSNRNFKAADEQTAKAAQAATGAAYYTVGLALRWREG